MTTSSLSVRYIITLIVILGLIVVVLVLLRSCGTLPNSITQLPTHSHTTERRVVLRADSALVSIAIPSVTHSLRARSNSHSIHRLRVQRDTVTPTDTSGTSLTASLDSVGFFSVHDSTQPYPDSLHVTFDLTSDLFEFVLKESPRLHRETIRYMARDSVIENRDSVHTKESLPLWITPALVTTGVVVGAIVTILITLVLH